VKIKTHHHDVCSHNKRKDKRTPPPPQLAPKAPTLLIGLPLSLNRLPSIGSMGFCLSLSLFFLDKKVILSFRQSRLLFFFFFKGFFLGFSLFKVFLGQKYVQRAFAFLHTHKHK
jgi:hypothetical protein